ncbi:MAG: FAD:protein FMN transferase [Planctomycetota bacterium]
MELYRSSFRAMGGENEIVVAADTVEKAQAALAAGLGEVLRIERKYSRYREDSVVSRINAAAGAAPVDCDAETRQLLDYADALFLQSGGLFDITSGILRKAWDFRAARVPEEAELAPLLARVGWQRVQREGSTVRLPEAGMEIDFGGFGKEYAADRAAAELARAGIGHGYVNLGGDIHAIGPRPGGEPWAIGVRHPRDADALIASIPLTRGALATSGDYQRFFEDGGRRYCHVLDPRSGRPVSHWASVTAVAPLAVMAGSVTTITMLKESAGLDFLVSTGLAYLCVDSSGHLRSNRVDREAGAAVA